ncbi:hypothetical protein PM076_14900 [Halorubrum ezzemoulense]|uniref:hypothetical protein n=1 Tax=Halorubrum ezzemoulense TaxID=337243 RepID=UPI00232C9E60|nr:hypothetical protein [Halorubrum ezzemoulense]MDB2245245.1 hypothetical protein [Halorubrum ezzemoulense]MDB2290101.1 hypothetical protein [Halorubrum ezzemoulense]MDB2297571.1 hypothetical protein [Halorubrum ezzemoulense]MDB2301151.1 hypothetical protein [Halorubrum ezzemoulense]
MTLDTDPRAQVVVLADGMGCPTGGKQASETAVSTTLDALRLAGDTAVTTPADTIKSGNIITSKTVDSEGIDPDDSPAGHDPEEQRGGSSPRP